MISKAQNDLSGIPCSDPDKMKGMGACIIAYPILRSRIPFPEDKQRSMPMPGKYIHSTKGHDKALSRHCAVYTILMGVCRCIVFPGNEFARFEYERQSINKRLSKMSRQKIYSYPCRM